MDYKRMQKFFRNYVYPKEEDEALPHANRDGNLTLLVKLNE